MSDGWTVNDEYTRGYDKALADLKPELDCLRAENAELREAVALVEQRSECAWTRLHCRALLAKTASHLPASDQEPQKSD